MRILLVTVTALLSICLSAGAPAQVAPTGNPLKISTTLTGSPKLPAAARYGRSATAGFVVVWVSDGQDGSGLGIYGQRYTAKGVRVGNEFRVNTYTNGDQTSPAIARLADGGFVVTWASNGQDGSGFGIYGRRYGATGAPNGGEFRINSDTADDQIEPAVASLPNGGFVVVWVSTAADAGDIRGRIFDSSGTPSGPDFPVGSTSGKQAVPAVSALVGGGFVVAWRIGAPGGGAYYQMFAQRFSSAGVPLGGTPLGNFGSHYDRPSVAPLSGGKFVVTWMQSQTGTYIWCGGAQQFDSAGNPDGGKAQVLGCAHVPLPASQPATAFGPDSYIVVRVADSGRTIIGRYVTPDRLRYFTANDSDTISSAMVSLAPVTADTFVVVWTAEVRNRPAIYGQLLRVR